MAKFVVGLAIVAFTSFCGYYLAKKYRKRASFYAQWWEFNERFLGEISYYRRPLGEFLSIYSYKNEFGVFIHSYFLSLSKERDTSNNIAFPDFFTEDETHELENYFCMLGKGDSGMQKGFFSAFKETLSKRKTNAVETEKKYGDLYLKLGFLIGLFILVLIV